jgi:hypothetical protein
MNAIPMRLFQSPIQPQATRFNFEVFLTLDFVDDYAFFKRRSRFDYTTTL